jgi:GAF domain-containing protein
MTSYGGSYGPETLDEELPVRATSIGGRAVLEGRSIHVEDVLPLLESEYPDVRELQVRHGFRSVLAVPMMREGHAIGVISLLRSRVQPFAPAEISLLQTFADQAVIAIQNTRLFNETQEALERQTATAEILRARRVDPAARRRAGHPGPCRARGSGRAEGSRAAVAPQPRERSGLLHPRFQSGVDCRFGGGDRSIPAHSPAGHRHGFRLGDVCSTAARRQGDR